MIGASQRYEAGHGSAIQNGIAEAGPAPCASRSARNPTIRLIRVISSATC
jgi:hypothetical protein